MGGVLSLGLGKDVILSDFLAPPLSLSVCPFLSPLFPLPLSIFNLKSREVVENIMGVISRSKMEN